MYRLNFSDMQAMQRDQLGFMNRMARERGGLVHLKILWFDFFLVSEPAVIRELLIQHADKTHRDPFVGRVFRRFMGEGVFIAEGETWKRKRQLVQPAFHAVRVREYAGVMAAYTREMVDSWEDGQELDLGRALTELTLRVIARTMFDVDLAAQTAAIGRRMQEILTVAEVQLKQSFSPPAWLPTPLNLRQRRALRGVHDLLREIIAARRASGRDHGDLLSMLLAARDEQGQGLSEQELLDECVTLFVAGHETTAAALTWGWHLLLDAPEVAGRLRAEVDRVVGDEPVTFSQLAEMPLLEGVIKETLRLYPPAFGFGRTVREPFAIGEQAFPRGAILMVNTFATQRRPDLFAEPEVFRPERFMPGVQPPERYAYLPFGAGPRICLGNLFAMLEAQVILATMTQRIELARVGSEPVELDTVITLRPRGGLRVRVARR